MFDFVNYTYSGILSIIAALIGLGCPLIIGRIEDIDNRYKSTLLTSRFKRESSFIFFMVMMIANTLITIILPFVLDYSTNARLWIALQSIFVLLLLVSLFVLFYDMLNYLDPQKLQKRILEDYEEKHQNEEQAKKYFNQWIDLTPTILNSADDQVAQIVYSEWSKFISRAYQQNNNTGELNEYFLNGLTRINENLCTGERRLISINNGNSILKSLLPYRRSIPENNYRCLWNNLLLQSYYGRDEWILEYWDAASQHYEYNKWWNEEETKEQEEKHEKDKWKFLEFHIMLVAILLRQKKYSLVKDMLTLSNSIPETYPLVPSTISDILFAFNKINTISDEPNKSFYFGSHYPIPNVHGISDGVILGAAFKYLALLIYRVYTLHWQFGKSAALNHQIAVDNHTTLMELSKWRDSLQIMQRWIERLREEKELLNMVFYNEKTIEHLVNLYGESNPNSIPSPKQIIEETEIFIEKSMQKIKTERPNDEEIEKDMRAKVASLLSQALVPYKVLEDSSFSEGKKYLINCSISHSYPNSAFQKGADISYVNIEETLAMSALNDFTQSISAQFYLAKRIQTYIISYDDIVAALGQLKPNSKHVILSFGFTWDNLIGVSSKLSRIDDHTCKYDKTNIYELPCHHPLTERMLYIVEEKELHKLCYERPNQNQIDNYQLTEQDEKYGIWLSILQLSKNENLKEQYQSLGNKIDEYSLFTVGWQPRLIKNDAMKTIAIRVWYEYMDEGKHDDVKSVLSIKKLISKDI